MSLVRTRLDTPLGAYVLVAGPEGITHLLPAGSATLPREGGPADARARRALEAARGNLEAYFAGACDAVDALALRPSGTPFQQRVWRALRAVPAGATATYAEIARRIGSPRAARAVGAANHRNPIAVAIPCHRVVAADGGLAGYAGGVARKRWLLDHEATWKRGARRVCGIPARQPPSATAQAASSKSKVPSTRAESADARSRESAAASI